MAYCKTAVIPLLTHVSYYSLGLTIRDVIIQFSRWCPRGIPLQMRHKDEVSNHVRLDCLFNRLIRRRPKKTSKLRITGFCRKMVPPVTGGFPSQRSSDAENVSIWCRHHPLLELSNCEWLYTVSLGSCCCGPANALLRVGTGNCRLLEWTWLLR